MKRRCVTCFLAATVAMIVAGCIVTEQARRNEPGGGTGVGIIDKPLDALTALEGNVGGALFSGAKSADTAALGAYHFAAGLVTSDPGPDLSALQKARRAEAKRRTTRREVVEKIGKAERTIDAPILDEATLDNLGMYLVWDSPLSGVTTRNVWVEKGVVLLDTKDDQTKDYKLFVLNLHNGFARWMYRFLSPLDSRPAVDADILWVSSASTIYALEPLLGGEMWKTQANFTVCSPIFTVGRRQYVGSLEHAVYALTGSDKYSDWHFETFAPISAMPIVDNSTLYVGSEDGTLYAYDFARRENLWQVRTAGPIVADPRHDENCLYFGSEGFNVYCVSKATGHINWEFPAQGPVRRPVRFLNDNTLLVRGEGAALYALDKMTGAEKWHDAAALYPVALGRFLYVLTEANTIKALDPETGEASWEQSAQPFAFVPCNLSTDAIALVTRGGQVFLIQEKNGMSLKPQEKVVQAAPEATEE